MKEEDLKKLQREEALKRIDALTRKFNLNPHIKDYFNEGRLYYSYITALILGQIDTIEYDARYVQVVKDFEERRRRHPWPQPPHGQQPPGYYCFWPQRRPQRG